MVVEDKTPHQMNGPALAVIDGEGKLIESNHRFGSLIDASESESFPIDWINYEANPALSRGMDVLRNSACLESVSMELKVGSDHVVKAIMSRLPDHPQDDEIRFLLMLEDQAPRKVGGKLREADLQKAILARFDHGLRSRLNIVSGYCAMVMEELSEKDDAAETLEDLRCVAGAGNELLLLSRKTFDLLDLIQGDWKIQREEVLPANILSDVIKEIRPKCSLHSFWLETDDTTIVTDPAILSKLAGSVMLLLCRELSDNCKIRITAGISTQPDSYEIVIYCIPSTRIASDKEKLEALTEQFRNRTRGDVQVPNLDLFYTDTLCESLGAASEADFDPDSGKLGYRIKFPDFSSPV